MATGILVAPAVTLTGEVDPFGMTELIAHEVEIASVDSSEGHKADELMQRHATGHHTIVVAHHHMPIHLLVNKAEDDGLVAHKSLIMALAIRDGLLVGPAVGKLPEYRGRMPVFILLLLDHLDPVIRDTHCHTVVESDAAILKLHGKPGHTAHLLSYGYSLAVYIMDKDIGKREICDGIRILIAVVVVGIRSESLPEAMVIIEHGGYTVETETVKLKFLKPVFTVREKEMEHAVFSVVEEKRVPCRMLAASVAIEIEVVAAVEPAETLHLILHGVGVHDIHNHGNAELVSLVDKTFQIVGSAEA